MAGNFWFFLTVVFKADRPKSNEEAAEILEISLKTVALCVIGIDQCLRLLNSGDLEILIQKYQENIRTYFAELNYMVRSRVDSVVNENVLNELQAAAKAFNSVRFSSSWP